MRLAVGVGVALAVATASYHLVERPLVRRRTRLVPYRRLTSTDTASFCPERGP